MLCFSSLCSGMLPEAVLPPSKEHSYAQWLERTYQPRESRSTQLGDTDGHQLLSPVKPQHLAISQSMQADLIQSRVLEMRTWTLILLFVFSLKAVNALETFKTKDMRQCTLCQHYGDSVPSVSFRHLVFQTPPNLSCVYDKTRHYIFLIIPWGQHTCLSEQPSFPIWLTCQSKAS